MKKALFATFLIGMSLVLFTGCGRRESPSDNSANGQTQGLVSGTPNNGQNQDPTSGTPTNRQIQNSASDVSTDGQNRDSLPGGPGGSQAQSSSKLPDSAQGDALFFQKYISVTPDFPEGRDYIKKIYADSYNGRLYLLSECRKKSDEAGGGQYSLYLFDADTQKTEKAAFSPEFPDMEDYSILSMDVKGSDELSFRLRKWEGDDYHDSLAITDINGSLQSLEETFPDKNSYPWNPDTRDDSLVFDNEDGTTLLSEWDTNEETSTLFWFDKETRSRRKLGELENECLSSLYLAEDNTLYYTAGGNLMRWDTGANTRQLLSRISDIGVPTYAAYTGLLRSSAGELLVCSVSEDKAGVFILSDQEPQSSGEIRFACLAEDVTRYSVKLASSYSHEHPDCPIRMEKSDGDAFRDRIFMELTTGNGPEMLWLAKEDLKVLAEKDLLMDLTELIPENIREQLWPCVIQEGTIDGRLAGLTPWFKVSSMAVSNAVWAENSWTLSDVLALAEKQAGLELLLGNPYKLNGYSLFFYLLPDMARTPFLDLEQGIAHFDHEDFKRLLEICMQYGGKTQPSGTGKRISDDALEKLLREGKCLAQINYCNWGLEDFSASLSGYGDEIHLVGYPSYGDSGNYISCNEYLAVSAKAEHLEEIREYIALLLDYDRQFLIQGCSVRQDVERDSVIEDSWQGQPAVLIKGPDDSLIQQPLALKPDGSTYAEEYMAFLESCVPRQELPSRISAILEEELGAYFSGTKGLADTVDIIQNRVQLYLDESGA